MKNAFSDITISSLNLNEGLEYIGNEAFTTNRLSEGLEKVEIPSTVKVIAHAVFVNNGSLFDNKLRLKASKIILINSETVIVDKHDW